MYQYKAFVTDVYDGDTITVDIDLGLHVWLRGETIRLFGINAPEVRGESRDKGLEARDYLRELILKKEVVLRTYKDKKGKYGRWLGNVQVDGIDVNQDMIDNDFAVKAEY